MKEIKTLQAGDEPELERYLLPRLESSVFLVGNARAAGLAYTGQRLSGVYVAAYEGTEIAAVVAHFWNGNLILQAPPDLIPGLARAAMAASGEPLMGILGPGAQVAAAMSWLTITASQCRIDEPENLYSLALKDLILPPALRRGHVRGRRSEQRDLDLLTAWRVAYSVEALGARETPALWQDCRAGIERHLAEQPIRTWILEAGGRPVATTGFNAVVADIVQVGGVYTPPELRSRGYGRAAVAASLLDARAEGFGRSILFTGRANLPAIKAYSALGYRQIGDYRMVLLREPLVRD